MGLRISRWEPLLRRDERGREPRGLRLPGLRRRVRRIEGSGSGYLATLRTPKDLYRTTETGILSALARIIHLSKNEGLRLVREACDELEETGLVSLPGGAGATAKATRTRAGEGLGFPECSSSTQAREHAPAGE